MPGTNQFLPFATGGSANTLTPAAYAALATVVANGFQPGVASSQQANTVWRQATFVAAAVAQLIANQNVNANDDGNLTNFVSNLQVAIANLGSLQAASLITLTANTTLTASQIGSTILGNSTATISATLPAANSVAAGKQVEFRNINTGTFNVLRSGSDTITVNAGTTTSQVLLLGDYLLLESNGSNSWYAVNGSILLPSSSTMLANFATLVSPALTGSPTAPTPALSDSTTKLATTAFVNASKPSIIAAGPVGVNANTVVGIDPTRSTFVAVYAGGFQGGNTYLNAGFNMSTDSGYSTNSQWFGQGVDYQVAASGTGFRLLGPGNGSVITIYPYSNGPRVAEICVFQF